ncbi:MAG TPA: response regulator [Nocardioidaceae bacterium]|nr:response regulator [Nocardioidaceae bacterium]
MAIRVLLVDDVVEVRRLVRTSLRFRGGFDVVAEASDGAEAIRLAEVLRPDIVVLDLGLPDIAGHEVLSQIRAASPGSKVVVFSGLDNVDGAWLVNEVEGFVLKDAELDYLVDLLVSVGQPPETVATLDLPQSLTSASEARHFVARKVTDWGLEALLDDALLVASELAANAITHADSACKIRLSVNAATLRIDVIDTGAGTPEPQPPSWTEEHGRGLHLVDALTTAWGLEIIPDGKLVWAELPRPVEHLASNDHD